MIKDIWLILLGVGYTFYILFMFWLLIDVIYG